MGSFVPIPNTEVKPVNVYGTVRRGGLESRKLPGFFVICKEGKLIDDIRTATTILNGALYWIDNPEHANTEGKT